MSSKEADDRDAFLHGQFPPSFRWSTATAAFQVEGAWNTDGKGESIWDRFCHEEGRILNGDTGDVACDSYRNYAEDVQLVKNLGCSHYRFSISWPRILPDGTKKKVNRKGIDYYNRVIECLLAAGIQPMVTLFHWDLPQALQDEGGWANDAIVQHFADYADICFREFGDKVKWWLTINEPNVVSWHGHGSGEFAPGLKDPYDSVFRVVHNLTKAHAQAYHIYKDTYKHSQGGQVGIALQSDWDEPKDPDSQSDVKAVELTMQIRLGWYAQPFLGNGDYPELLKTKAADIGRAIGAKGSPLPTFTETEIAMNKGSCDFFGLNYYTSRLVTMEDVKALKPDQMKDVVSIFGISEHLDPTWSRGGIHWLYHVPWGLRRLLCWIKDRYSNPPVFITENGTSNGSTTQMQDNQRIDYIRRHVNEVLKAVLLDNCDVIGYTAWSLMDNFEWADGYGQRFGLYHVDFDDPDRKRAPKASVAEFARIIRNNGFPQ